MRIPDERQKIWSDPQRLEDWTNARLDAFGVHDDDLPIEALSRMPPAVWRRDALAVGISEARRGNPEPLRRLLPALAEFIHSPPRRRGQQRRPQANYFEHFALEIALDTVRCIRTIWQEDFDWSYRSAAPTAVAIAARRNGLSEDELVNFRKNRHRLRKNRQRKR